MKEEIPSWLPAWKFFPVFLRKVRGGNLTKRKVRSRKENVVTGRGLCRAIWCEKKKGSVLAVAVERGPLGRNSLRKETRICRWKIPGLIYLREKESTLKALPGREGRGERSFARKKKKRVLCTHEERETAILRALKGEKRSACSFPRKGRVLSMTASKRGRREAIVEEGKKTVSCVREKGLTFGEGFLCGLGVEHLKTLP